MAGLIETQVPPLGKSAGYDAAQATATQAIGAGYDPSKSQVDDNQTVQGQIAKITASDSPLMQQTQRRANEAMNARGLINSSMAVGAAQDAVIGQALPIATQDANTHLQTSFKNMDADNAAKAFRAGAENQASLANAQLGTDVSKFNAGAQSDALARGSEAANNAALANLDASTRTNLAQLDASTRTNLAQLDSATRIQLSQMDMQSRANLMQIEKGYSQLLQANQSASSMYNQAVAAIANISQNTTLAPAAKDAAIQTQLNMLKEGLAVTAEIARNRDSTVANLNLSSYFDQSMGDQISAAQIQTQRLALQSAVNSARSQIPQWGVNEAIYVAPPGPNQSERTAANFNALYAQKYQEYQNRVAELNAFNAQYPVTA